MHRLVESYRDDSRVRHLLTALRDHHPALIGSCQGCLPLVFIAAAWRDLADEPDKRPALLIHGDPDTCVDDLEEMGVAAAVLAERDGHEQEDEEDDHDDPARHRRAEALRRLGQGHLLVGTPRACRQRVPRLHDLGREAIRVAPGEQHDIHDLAERLTAVGYTVATVAERPGQIAVRGGILDVYPLIGRFGFRLDFFGDEIDTLRRFDPFTQESIATLAKAELITAGGAAHTASLWDELPQRPILLCSDLDPEALFDTPAATHRPYIRLARQLAAGACDGASVTAERFAGDLLRDCRELSALDPTTAVLVFARNPEAARQLGDQFAAHDLDRIEIREGRLSAGWRDCQRDLLVVHDFELARRRPIARRARSRVPGGAPLSSLNDLRAGDFVVHLKHGIARFRGMTTLEKRGFLEDHLLLEFAEGTRLFVPVSGIDLIQKYIGGAGRHPELSRIGGAAWARKRARAERAIEDLTADLLAAQVERITAGGVAITSDEAAYAAFCAAFPYEETEDQLSAIREIREAMARPAPMDRLLCGDVGFGKTEVAMRAAFTAASAGLQTVVLAPTTLLTEQHAESFCERFVDTPFQVACMNRYRSTAQRSAILARMAAGEIHILIGTHALLTEELRCAALGLLIIDEEQRFGVKQKEFLKRLRSGVDCLTLSATPIPRTLHAGMLGLRDISVLGEAPADRLAVQTAVAIWDGALVRDAMRRELERGGQIFVVHNRVQDIDRLAFKISRLVPEMSYAIIHGQMNETETGRIMRDYKHGHCDCLIATSIIESGIDIPNANTLVVNNAHCFGLAELHQIRGRIGRYSHQAYAYFITPPTQRLGAKARERLDAIQEYAELGAGFKLALRDLELRGAGNLLGAEQSGHIEAIGYELYCKLLNEAVERHRAGTDTSADAAQTTTPDTVLAFPLDAYIPDDWLDAPSLKFQLHKAIDDADHLGDLRDTARAAIDRFGPLAAPVRRLFAARALRLAGRRHGITSIASEDHRIHLTFAGPVPRLDATRCPDIRKLRATADGIACHLNRPCDQDRLLALLSCLLELDLAFLDRDRHSYSQPVLESPLTAGIIDQV